MKSRIDKVYRKQMKLRKKLHKIINKLTELEKTTVIYEYLRKDDVNFKLALNSIYGKSVYADTDSCKERKET